jgi:acyl-CoA synthetase (NDP forming)
VDTKRMVGRFLQPKSIAVFGGKQAEEVIRQCLKIGFKGEIWPVHPKKNSVLGLPAFSCATKLPSSPDASYLAVNRELTIDIVGKLATMGAGGAVCYATGFREAKDGIGPKLEQELLEASLDMPLIGPNCYGLLNYRQGAVLWPDQQAGRLVDRGVAIITMSSNVAFNLNMQRNGLPVAYSLSLGNKLKFDLHDAIRIFSEIPEVTAIGLFIESISSPAQLEQAANYARELCTPIVAIKTGRSEIAQKVAISHTASLAGSDSLVEALFEKIGIARLESLEELIEALKVLHVVGPISGNRIGVMSTSGGDCSIIADTVDDTILNLPALAQKDIDAIRATVHERVDVANPLDYQMFDWGNEARLSATFTRFAQSGFDLSVSLLDFPRLDCCIADSWLPARNATINAAKESGVATAILATFSNNMPEAYAIELIDLGVIPLAGAEAGIAGIEAAVKIGEYWSTPVMPPLKVNKSPAADTGSLVIDEAESKKMLSFYGVPIPKQVIVSAVNGFDLQNKLADLTFPLVVKALGVAHKTDVGGVRLMLQNSLEIEQAIREMAGLSSDFLIEEMVQDVIAELLVGCSRDEQFGPYLVIGSGGVLVELLQDSRSLLLPTTREQVKKALTRLQGFPLLQGFRGNAKADIESVVDAILAIATFVEEHSETIMELDINPLLVVDQPQGVIVADALMRFATTEMNPGEKQ